MTQPPTARAHSTEESWPEVLLDSVATRGSGHTPNKKQPSYWNGSIKWVSLRDSAKLDLGLISSTTSCITQAGLDNSSAVLHPRGSVILLRDAGIGKSAVLADDMAVSQHFISWSCGPKLHNWFLYYVLQSRKSEFERISNGSTIKTIGLDYFKQMKVPLPDYREQERIATALRDADELISSTQALIAKKEDLKQGVMQQLLHGETRLPSYDDEWQESTLAELVSYEQPTKFLVESTRQLPIGRYPVLTAGKTFILGYTNEEHGVYRDHPVIIFDDFTTASQYVDFDFKAKSSAMKILSARPGLADVRFIFERMQLINFPLGDHKRYWISEYGKQSIRVPSLKEQQAIAQVAHDLNTEIETLKRKLQQTESIRQGMMQSLLTGNRRL